jgi:hypothetical protein
MNALCVMGQMEVAPRLPKMNATKHKKNKKKKWITFFLSVMRKSSVSIVNRIEI